MSNPPFWSPPLRLCGLVGFCCLTTLHCHPVADEDVSSRTVSNAADQFSRELAAACLQAAAKAISAMEELRDQQQPQADREKEELKAAEDLAALTKARSARVTAGVAAGQDVLEKEFKAADGVKKDDFCLWITIRDHLAMVMEVAKNADEAYENKNKIDFYSDNNENVYWQMADQMQPVLEHVCKQTRCSP